MAKVHPSARLQPFNYSHSRCDAGRGFVLYSVWLACTFPVCT